MYQSYNIKRKRKFNLTRIIPMLIVVLIVVGIIGLQFVRFDFESGSHRIIPTAVDSDFWGNYRVFYRTTDFTKNSEEDFYYIEKGDEEIVEQMREAIKNNKNVLVYYDKYIGFKGITAPKSSPIIKIEVIE